MVTEIRGTAGITERIVRNWDPKEGWFVCAAEAVHSAKDVQGLAFQKKAFQTEPLHGTKKSFEF